MPEPTRSSSGHEPEAAPTEATRRPPSDQSAESDAGSENSLPPPPFQVPKLAPSDVDERLPEIPGYEFLECLARGGMGVVYKARQTRLNRLVAVKMILSGMYAGLEARLRFQIEAEAVARLQHPQIVQIYEVGEHRGMPFFALEYLEGGTLGRRGAAGPSDPDAAARIIRQLAGAAHYAHLRGVVHRDLKPANILLAADGTPKIADFGLAKRIDADRDHTVAGAVVGTACYMSPEQATGAAAITPATDIWSLGVIFYELLTGRVPFDGATETEIRDRIRGDEPPPWERAVSRDLQTICLKCLEKDPSRRYATAQDLADDLDRHFRYEPIRARRTPPIVRLGKWIRRHPMRTTLSGVVLAAAVAGWFDHQRRQSAEAKSLVQTLLTADVERVPALVRELEPHRGRVRDELRRIAITAPDDSRERRHAALALVADDEKQVEFLARRLPEKRALAEFVVIRDALTPFRGDVVPHLWRVLHADGLDRTDRRRFRAGLALATYAPRDGTWTDDDFTFLARQLVASHPDEQRELRSQLSPLADRLVGPLEAYYRDPLAREGEKPAAATALADFARGRPERLARVTCDADPGHYALLFPALAAQGDVVRPLLSALVREPLAPDATEAERIRTGRRRAAAAVTLLRLGDRDAVSGVLSVGDDPEALTQFVHRSKDLGVAENDLIERLDSAATPYDRFALLLALGEFRPEEIEAGQRRRMIDLLSVWSRDDPSAAVHSASAWLLRAWDPGGLGSEPDRRSVDFDPTGRREWFIEKVGDSYLTFVVVPPGRCRLGSPSAEKGRHPVNEASHVGELTDRLAVCAFEVTVADWKRFLADTGRSDLHSERHSPTDDHPANNVTWFAAVEYCRWLTRRAGLPDSEQCYEDPGAAAGGVRGLPDNRPVHVDRKGFRLPTELEWEYFCRCGQATPYGFGSDRSLLDRYACFEDNSNGTTHRVGTHRPNLYGLFDLHGNVYEWCHDWFADYPPAPPPNWTGPSGPGDKLSRVFHGGAWDVVAKECRSAFRGYYQPDFRNHNMGLRVVRRVPVAAGAK